VMLNLVSNAIKFTQRGQVSIALEVLGQTATVSVSDTGLGIPTAEQATIFDEFRRSERSIERGYGGLGLGLSICKRLVELHGGAIGVESQGQEGAGSRFFFTLPLIDAPAELPAARPDAHARGAPVLILTASSAAIEGLCDYLERRGYEVLLAPIDEPSTWHALVLTTLPSAIVLDVSAGSDQGWRVLKGLKANLETSKIPVLFYAIATESAPAAAGTEPRASVLELDYLTKPIELATLASALDQRWLAPTPDRPVRKFLVVDDDPDTLDMHARIVQDRSPANQVYKARNGLEALRVLQEERIDLVLLDLMMPEMDGFEVLEAMRDRPSARDVPVIVVTGQTLSESEMARLNLGVTKVLSKGVFSIEETVSHLDAALERRRELSSEAQRLVRQAMAYMHAHYAEPLSREEIAAHVGLSDDYLTACFHKELGLTPVAYLNRYRVQQAKQLLKNTHKSITEIALEVGFSGSSYFSRVFHRETGMSPGEYRHT
nr:response regulator [Anaerolineae bacterium]